MKRRKTGAVNSKKIKRGSIEFSSSLEAYAYDRLKENDLDFAYEGESFVVLESFKYGGVNMKSTSTKKELVDQTGKLIRAITYKPDFVSHKHKFVIETKGFVPSNHSFPLRWKLFLKHLNDNGMSDYSVYLPKNRSQVDEALKHIIK